jgi:hypothetical protein
MSGDMERMPRNEMSDQELHDAWVKILAQSRREPSNWESMTPRQKSKWCLDSDESARLKYDQFLRGEYVLPRQEERRLRPSAKVIPFPLERTRRPARRSGYKHERA